VLLGIFFIFVGVMKITSQVSKDLHKDLVRIAVYLMSCIMTRPTIKLQSRCEDVFPCCICNPLSRLVTQVITYAGDPVLSATMPS
jgi:hypothetical protein